MCELPNSSMQNQCLKKKASPVPPSKSAGLQNLNELELTDCDCRGTIAPSGINPPERQKPPLPLRPACQAGHPLPAWHLHGITGNALYRSGCTAWLLFCSLGESELCRAWQEQNGACPINLLCSSEHAYIYTIRAFVLEGLRGPWIAQAGFQSRVQ